jgi:hypothetical protein
VSRPPERISAVQFRGLAAREVAKPSKYRNRKVTIDGITFHSAHEGQCYSRLKLREKAGEIRALRLQPSYDLIVNGELVCKYVADFEYEERTGPDHERVTFRRGNEPVELTIRAEGWRLVTEDAKGARTKDYVIKAKLFRALYGREVRET